MTEGVPPFTPKLAEAFSYALELHGTQVRKRAEDEVDHPGIPYMAHLMAVTALVLEHGGDACTDAIRSLIPIDSGQ